MVNRAFMASGVRVRELLHHLFWVQTIVSTVCRTLKLIEPSLEGAIMVSVVRCEIDWKVSFSILDSVSQNLV